MKKLNKLLFIACMIIGANLLASAAMHDQEQKVHQLDLSQFDTAVAQEQHVANNNSVENKFVIPDEHIANTPSHARVKSILDQLADKKDTITYDDQQRLKIVESLALEQKGGDIIEAVAFNFEDIDLQNVANYMERVHKVKFVTDDILDTSKGQKLAGNKISFRTNAPLSKEESWSLFVTFLSMAGLDIIPMAHAGFYRIVPLPSASQEAIPAYIGSSPALLPDNDMLIRYVYFVQNADPTKIQGIMSKFQGSTGSLQVYKDLKALIFTDKSYNIKSLMDIVKELDKPVSPQSMSVMKLKKANVEDVINLYNSLKPTGQQRAWAPDSKDPASEFFSQNISLAGDKRTNTLIILGPKDAVTRLEDFVIKYVDVSLDGAGKTPVFVYNLEYTNATDVQKILSQLVSYGSSSSAGQYGGVRDGQKYLQPMSIVASTYSNSLIINATPEDYAAVEKLIKQIDVPQKQVALEVLIVQVTSTKTKQLGAQISGPNNDNTFLPSISAQTSGIPPASGIVTTAAPNAQGIAQSIKSNLSSLLLGPINQAGSTILTFGQPIWAIFKILKTIATTRIIQNPFVVVSNNSKGYCKVGTSRRVVTGEAISAGNTAVTGYQTAEANLEVTIVPQVNDEGVINLAISINNNQFVNVNSPNDAVQDQKTITTMASLADGEVLVLGGIMADRSASTTSGVPLLAQIPLFGWLFKNKQQELDKNMFIVFICPKVLDNINNQEEIQVYTRAKLEETQRYLRMMDEIDDMDSQQDPLDKIFFGARDSRADDLSVERLLDRKELVSHHEPVQKEPVGTGKPKKSKYNKKVSQQTKESKTSATKSSTTPVVSPTHKYAKRSQDQKSAINTKQNIVIDMSEKQSSTSNQSVSALKNVVQMSSGVSA